MKNSFIPTSIFFLFFLASSAQTCRYTLSLYDSLGDTWNGAALTVQWSSSSERFSIDDSSIQEQIFEISIEENEDVQLIFTSGAFDQEISYTWAREDSIILYESGSGPVAGLNYEFVSCTECIMEMPLISYYDHRNIWFEFSDLTGELREIIYGPSGFDLSMGIIDQTRGDEYMIGGLEADSLYDFYFRANCGADSSMLKGPLSIRTRREIDGGVDRIVPVLSGCDLPPAELGYFIKNYGGRPLTFVPLHFSVNTIEQAINMPVDGLYTGLLGPDSTDYFFFDQKYTFPGPGDYEFTVWSQIEGDSLLSNDSSTILVTYSPKIESLPYSEGFEEWSGGWYSGADYLLDGQWQRTGSIEGVTAFEGQTVWKFESKNMSADDVNVEYLYSPCYDFSNVSDKILVQFALQKSAMEFREHILSFEYSLDGGDTWRIHEPTALALNWHEDNLSAWTQPMNEDWFLVEDQIPELSGEQNVRFRFGNIHEGSFDSLGWQIDHFKLEVLPSNDVAININTRDLSYFCDQEKVSLGIRLRNMGNTEVSDFEVVIRSNGNVIDRIIDLPSLGPNEDTLLSLDLGVVALDATASVIEVEIIYPDDNLNNNTDLINAELLRRSSVPYIIQTADMTDDEAQYWRWGDAEAAFGGIASGSLRNELNSLETWTIRSQEFDPLPSNTFLELDLNWQRSGGAVELGDTDSIYIYTSSNCFEDIELLEVLTKSNFDPAENSVIRLDLSEYEGALMSFEIVFKNQASLSAEVYFTRFQLLSCDVSIEIEPSFQYASHPDSADGALHIRLSGGNEPYQNNWNGQTGDSFSRDSLSPGVYYIEIGDANGCKISDSFFIESCSEDLDVQFEVIPNDNGLEPTGSIQIRSIPGDISDYSIRWSNEYYNVPGITGLSNKLYRVEITDSFSCSYIYEFDLRSTNTIEQPKEILEISIYPNPVHEVLHISSETEIHILSYSFVSSTGELLLDRTVDQWVREPLRIDRVPRGVNYLIVRTKSASRVFKVVGN